MGVNLSKTLMDTVPQDERREVSVSERRARLLVTEAIWLVDGIANDRYKMKRPDTDTHNYGLDPLRLTDWLLDGMSNEVLKTQINNLVIFPYLSSSSEL